MIAWDKNGVHFWRLHTARRSDLFRASILPILIPSVFRTSFSRRQFYISRGKDVSQGRGRFIFHFCLLSTHFDGSLFGCLVHLSLLSSVVGDGIEAFHAGFLSVFCFTVHAAALGWLRMRGTVLSALEPRSAAGRTRLLCLCFCLPVAFHSKFNTASWSGQSVCTRVVGCP